MTNKSQTVGGTARTVGYGYTNGLLTSLTTPSGQAVAYSYTNGQVTGITVNGTAVLSNVVYEPFGPARSWTWGNSTAETRLHDTDGNPSLITGAESTNYSLDNAFRIQGITNSNTPAASWTYDANGSRQTQGGATAPAYAVSALSFAYNNRGRMASATASGTTSYVYNALGQRISKSGPGGATVFAYDEAGHLLGEYTSAGVLTQETIWLGDLPVTTIRPGSPVAIYYVHADHLGTPRAITRSSDNAKMWRWDSDPFGVSLPNQSPGGLGVFTYNLRYPGQYFDVETGLNYNYFRDYDGQTGRYMESDPLGLRAGVNTYAYVRGNPLRSIDSRGLVEWNGTISSVSVVGGVGASMYRLSLKSKCVNGKRGTAEVVAVGPSMGLDIKGAPPLSTTASDITLNDRFSYVDPSVLSGWFSIWSAGVAFGGGFGCSAMQLGGSGLSLSPPAQSGAYASPSCGKEYGLDIGAGTTAGSATVVKSSVTDCGCDKP